MRKQKEKDTDA